jgi:hypothetical protein
VGLFQSKTRVFAELLDAGGICGMEMYICTYLTFYSLWFLIGIWAKASFRRTSLWVFACMFSFRIRIGNNIKSDKYIEPAWGGKRIRPVNAFADIFAPSVIVSSLTGLAAHIKIQFFPVA